MEAIPPASHNSPGPRAMASHGATTDEDSQESMTLQKALAPLPDTQTDGSEHDLSSPTEREGAVQLLSRPQNLDVDPGESFSWGKPVKVIPGQFSRPVPTKSIVDTAKGNVPANSPLVIGTPNSKSPGAVRSGSVQSLPIVSRQFGHVVSPNSRLFTVEQPSHVSLASIEGSFGSEENHRPVTHDAEQVPRVQTSARRPPFEDYVPQYRRPDAKEQVSTAQTSTPRRPSRPDGLGVAETQNHDPPHLKAQAPRQGNICIEQGRGNCHSVNRRLQRDQIESTVQIDEPRQRMSLPNDTSISPAQTTQQLPRETSEHHVLREGLAEKKALGKSPYLNLNRPMRDIRQVSKLKTPNSCLSSRSSAHGSNISKRRARPRPSASSRPHPSRQHNNRHHDDTPSIRGRGGQHAASRPSSSLKTPQQSNESFDIDMVAGSLAQALNNNFGMMRDEWKRKEQDIAYLENNIRKQEEKLSNFKRQSEGKSGRIQELEEDRIRLQERLESANEQLDDRSNKLSELQKKCRAYKEHLNSATAEQQDLYKAAKAKCETAIQQMRDEEHKRKMLDEQHRKDLQVTRERLTQVVKSTVAEYSSKEREFSDKLESLHQRVQEREADVERERETIRRLLEQSATVESIQSEMKTFGAHIAQISAKLGDIASGQVNRDEAVAEETRVKLDKIVQHLSALDERVEPQANIIEKIQEANVHTFSTFLNPVIESNTEIQSNLEKLADAVEDYMEDFWMKLEDREDVLVELLEKTQAENAQLQADVQLREDECNVLSYELEQAGSAARQRERELENSRNEIADLEKAQANDIEHAARADLLHEDCEKLKVEVAAKVAVARDLEGRLQHCQAELLNEKERHKRHTEELQKLMEQHEVAARAAQEAAIKVARQEVTHDMSIAKEKISLLLKQAEAERIALKDELDVARQQVSTVQETNKRADTTITELRSELETAQADASQLGEEMNEKGLEMQKAIDHNSKQVTDLEAKVAQKEVELAQLLEDAETYEKQVQKALGSLKEWTKDHQDVRGFISELRKAQDGDLEGIDTKLKAILEIDLLHQAIFQYCHAQGRLAPNGDQGTADESLASENAGVDLLHRNPPENMPTKNLWTRVLDQVGRRVTIRSPSQGAPSPIPPSVSAEQEHRRSANPPRSIMKAGTQSNIIEDEDMTERGPAAQSFGLPSRGSFGRRTSKRSQVARERRGDAREQIVQDNGTFTRSDFTRAPYNRPVSGTNPRGETLIDHDETRVGRKPKKRKQGDRQKADSSTKPVSVGAEEESPRPLLPHLSPPESQVSQGGEFQEPPSAPRKRARKNTGDSISPVRSFYFKQNAPTAGREARRKGHNQHEAKEVISGGRKASLAPKASSQDAQSLDYPRHRSSQQNEDSQDSITHSQGGRSEPAVPTHRRNRLPWYYDSL